MTVGNKSVGTQRPPNAESFFPKDLLDVAVGHEDCAGLALLNMHRNKPKLVSDSTRVAAGCHTCGPSVSTRCGGNTTLFDSDIYVESSDVRLHARDGESSQTKRNDGS